MPSRHVANGGRPRPCVLWPLGALLCSVWVLVVLSIILRLSSARVGSTRHESLQDLGLLGARAGWEAARPREQPPRCGGIY